MNFPFPPVQLAGIVRHAGLVEVPFGITLRELIEGYGGGTHSGRPLRTVRVGGPLGAYLPVPTNSTAIDPSGVPDLTIGIDLGDRNSDLCAIKRNGEILEEPRLPTTPRAFRQGSPGCLRRGSPSKSAPTRHGANLSWRNSATGSSSPIHASCRPSARTADVSRCAGVCGGVAFAGGVRRYPWAELLRRVGFSGS